MGLKRRIVLYGLAGNLGIALAPPVLLLASKPREPVMRHDKSHSQKPSAVAKPSAKRAKGEKQLRCPNCGIPFKSNPYATAQEYLDRHLRHCKG